METEELDIKFMKATNRSIKALTKRLKSAEQEIELLDGIGDLMYNRLNEADKMLFGFIVHLAKNGELRSLFETLTNKQKKKPLEVVVAFDGDEAGEIALNRFMIDQLCGEPKKFKISANLESKVNKGLEEMERTWKGFIKKYYEDGHPHSDKKGGAYRYK